jgi:KaiC/GvpD/RAD55 family RecA-like ATPase
VEKRTATGIKGFDNLIEGGFPQSSVILVSGSPGTGKSLFSMQYLYNGALQFGEVGLYVTFEQEASSLRREAKKIGLTELERLEQEGKLVIMALATHKVNKSTTADIISKAKEINSKRLVIDSITALSINAPIYDLARTTLWQELTSKTQIITSAINSEDLKKNFIYQFIEDLRQLNATSLMVSQVSEKKGSLSSDSVSEFVADGIVLLSFESMGGAYSRSLMVRKMRETKNDDNPHPLEVGENGFIVHDLS